MVTKKKPAAVKTAAKKAPAKKRRQPAYKPVERKTDLGSIVGDALSELQSLRDECSEARDNMEEKLSHTDKYQMFSDAADTLDSHVDSEPDVPERLQGQEVTYNEYVPTRKGRGTSRATRLSNAVSMLQAAEEVANECGNEDLGGEIREIIDGVESVEFPGMFG